MLLAELESVAEAITSQVDLDLEGPAAAEAALRVHRAVDRLHATRLGWLAAAEDHGVWLGSGARSFRAWVARTHEVAFAEAGRWVRSARVLRELAPSTARAARLGQVPTSKAALIAAAATTPRRVDALRGPVDLDDDPDLGAGSEGGVAGEEAPRSKGGTTAEGAAASRCATGEGVLLGLAPGMTVEQFAQVTRRFAHVVDPEADERGYREALAREHLDLASTTGGYHLSGFLTVEHGQLVKTALRAVTGVPASGDSRSAGQRRAGALTSLARLVLDTGVTGKVGTVRPHLSVHVSFTELEGLWSRVALGERGQPEERVRVDLASLVSAPPAEWEDGRGPIPEHVLRRIAADSEVTRVVFGPDSQVLDVGRAARTFSGHLRRAVVARDRECVVDGCGAPPSIGEIHHAVTRWADGGTTSIDNAALVCAFHNQWLEDQRVPMRWVTEADGRGRWEIGAPGTYRPPPQRRVPRAARGAAAEESSEGDSVPP